MQPHPETRLRHELRERARTCESLGADALDAELLHDALGTEGARTEHLAHPAATERAAERVATEALTRLRRVCAVRSALILACHLVSVCLATGLAGHARADELPKLVLVREGVPGADAPAGLARQLADALAARGLAVREAPEPTLVDEPDERAALAVASEAYTALRPGDARQEIDDLLARADARGSSGLDDAGRTRALLLLSLAALALGDVPAADAALDRLLAADPTVVADAATYPPPLRARLETRRASIAALPLVSLEVVTAPGAVIELDGHALPDGQTERRVPPGPHLVRARAPGHLPAGARVDASADPTQLTLPLAPDPGAVLAAPGRPGAPLGAEQLAIARSLEVSLLVVDVSRGPSGLVVDAHDGSSGHRAHMVVPTNIAARALALRIASALLAPTPIASAVPRPPAKPRIWPWLVAASVVAVGAVAVGVALAVSDEPNGFVLVPVAP